MPKIKVAKLVKIAEPFILDTIDKPVPGPKDVLVKVAACSLVPNSSNVASGKTPFSLPELPCVFGLDVSGTIEAVGEHVTTLCVGDRCYVDPLLTCGTCSQCRNRRRDLCDNSCLRGYFAVTPGGCKLLQHYPIGGLSQYVLSPDTNVAVLPDSIDFPLASRLGYIGTSFGGLKKAQAGPGKTLLINGVTGTLGYAAVAIALGMGCSKVLGIGRNKDRLAEVERLSEIGRVVVRSSEETGDLASWAKKETNGLGPDAFYDCLGVGGDASSTSDLIGSVKRGGRAVLAAGGAGGEISRTYSAVMSHDVATLGTYWFDSAEVDELISLIASGVVDFSFLKHKLFALEDVNEAFEAVRDRPGGACNIVVCPNGAVQ